MPFRRMVVAVVTLVAILAITVTEQACEAQDKRPGAVSDRFVFREVWGYLMKGEEQLFTGFEPVTDLCYFSAAVNDIGRIDEPIPRPDLPERSDFRRRIHLVISSPASKALMYFCLRRDRETRSGLITDIVRLSRDYDGVQVDFEAIRPEEGQAYVSFLSELKRRLGGKVLSVAVPARTSRQKDAFDYPSIAEAADRVVVMAYDEHWRTGPAGPVASTAWCRKVSKFAMEMIPPETLVMGLPLYGRAWQVEENARALKYQDAQQLLKTYSKQPLRGGDDCPHFQYKASATMDVYYEDMQSLTAKLKVYRQAGVRSVGFWRIGQGPEGLWSRLAVGS